MSCDRTPKTCPGSQEFWLNNDAFKKAVIELLANIANGEPDATTHVIVDSGNICNTCAIPAGSNAIGSVSVSNFPATQPVSGSVSVSNFPATQPVSGSVSVSNFPATQPVSGTVDFVVETTIGSGRTTVAAAGTRVALAGSTSCKRVDIQALSSNTGAVVVGGSGVVAAVGTRQGIALTAGQVYSFAISNLSTIYIDSIVNGEGVNYTYFA